MKKIAFFTVMFVMMISVPVQGFFRFQSVEVEGEATEVSYLSHEITEGQLEVTVDLSSWDGKTLKFRNGEIYIPIWLSAECGGKMGDSLSVNTDPSSMTYTIDCSVQPEKIYAYSLENEDVKVLIWEAGQPAVVKNDDAPAEDIAAEEDVKEGSGLDGMMILLEELDEPLYDSTLDLLRSGDPIRNGTQGDAVRGVQTLLNEFGKNLPLTGGFYNMSLSGLQDVERVFGMEKTDFVDTAVFEELLINLHVYRNLENEDGNEILLPEELGISLDQETYLKACSWEMKGKFYKAYNQFYLSDWEDFEARMDACVQKWPANGEIYHNPSYYGDGATLNILVGKEDGQAMLIKIMRGDTLISALFLGNGTNVSTSLPAGTYTIKTGIGDTWFGLNDAFGEDGYYETLLFDDNLRDVALDYGYDYTLRLNFTGEADPAADDVGSQTESFDDF